jgi:hypothetical protein
MGIFGVMIGKYIDGIHWTDGTRDTMVRRVDRAGHQVN